MHVKGHRLYNYSCDLLMRSILVFKRSLTKKKLRIKTIPRDTTKTKIYKLKLKLKVKKKTHTKYKIDNFPNLIFVSNFNE